MSVINKMLNDLETRKERADDEMVPLVAHDQKRNRGAKPLVLVLAIALWAAGGAYWWQLQKTQAASATESSLSTQEHSTQEKQLAAAQSPSRDVNAQTSETTIEHSDNTSPARIDRSNEAQVTEAVVATTSMQESPTSISPTQSEQTKESSQTKVTPKTNGGQDQEVVSSSSSQSELTSNASASGGNTVDVGASSSPATDKTLEPKAQSEISVAAVPNSQTKTNPEPRAKAQAKTKPKTKSKPTAVDTTANKASNQHVSSAKQEPESSLPAGEMQVKALELSSEQLADLHTRRGNAFKDKNDLERARKEYKKVLQFDGARHAIREQLAALLYGAGQTNQAIELLQQGMQRYPNEAGLRLMLARIYTQNKDTTTAYTLLKMQTPEISGNIDYYAMLAGLAQQAKDYERSRQAYQTLISVDPLRSRWWMGLGIAEDQLANYAQALAGYQRALELGKLSSSSTNYLESRIKQLEQ